MRNIFLKIKQQGYWLFLLRFVINPIFNFFWTNFLNLKGRYLYFRFKKKKFDNLEIDPIKPVMVLRDDEDFKNISSKIKNNLSNFSLEDEIIENKKSKNFENDNKNFKIELLDKLDDSVKKEIINFAKSEKILSIVCNYLKVFPVIGKIHVSLNYPVENKKERSSMLWHKDDFGYRSLDFFVLLCDVNKNNGPMYYLNKKNHLGIFTRVPEIIENAKPKERNKIHLENFDRYVKKDEIRIFEGKVGDTLLIDSFNVYHRGGYCIDGKRLMLRISYQTPDAARLQKIDHKSGFFYFTKIKKEHIFDKHQKYLFFGSELMKKKKLIVNFLLYLYRILGTKEKKIDESINYNN